MSFRDHLSSAVTLGPSTLEIGELPALSKAHEHRPLLLESSDSQIPCRTALNICQESVMAESMSITSVELVELVGWAIENPQEPENVDNGVSSVLENTLENPDLSHWPIPHYYAIDAGRYLTSAMVFVTHQGISNASFHRMLVLDERHMVARLVPRHLHRIVHENRAQGDETQIAIVIGADPTVLLAAAISFDFDQEEASVAAAMHQRGYGKSLELTRLSNGILVPAHSEMVLEAVVLTEDCEEGPFVDITGTVDDLRMQPMIRVDRIHHRDEPIFHALIPAGIEHRTLMGLPRSPTIKAEVDKVSTCLDVRLTTAGSGWLSAVVSIEQATPGEAVAAIHAAFRGHPSMKKVVIVDGDIDIGSLEEVEWAVLTRAQPDRDHIVLSEQRGSSLDPSRYSDGTTSKLGIDATIPFGEPTAPYRRYV